MSNEEAGRLVEWIRELGNCTSEDVRRLLTKQKGVGGAEGAFAAAILLSGLASGDRQPGWFNAAFEVLAENSSKKRLESPFFSRRCSA